MKLLRKAGATSNIFQVFAQDSSSTTGAGLTGLAFNTASLTAYYHRDTDTTATAITLVTMTVGTFTSSGFKEIDATNMPGWYQFCPPDAAIAAGAKSCGFHIKGATNLAPLPLEVQLVAFDPDDAVRLGLTSLPNATAGATNGLPLSVDSSGRVDTLKINGTSQTARDLGASVLLSSGTGTGQLDFTSGVVKSNLAQILGTALTETAGQIAAAFKKLFDVASPAFTATSVNQTGDAYARLGAPAGASTAADIAAIKNDTGTAITDTANIKTRLPAALTGGGNMKSDPQAINGDATSAANLAKTTRSIARGTVTSGATTTSIPTSVFTPAGAAADQFKGLIVRFDGDTTTTALRGCATDITASSNAATPTLTVTALPATPAAGDTFSVI